MCLSQSCSALRLHRTRSGAAEKMAGSAGGVEAWVLGAASWSFHRVASTIAQQSSRCTGSAEGGLYHYSCFFSFVIWAAISSSSAQPDKYQLIISVVRRVGLHPVYSAIRRQARMAA